MSAVCYVPKHVHCIPCFPCSAKEIPMMRRLPFPMAISTAFEMLQGKMSLKDYGSAPWIQILPGLVNVHIAMENHHRNSDFSHE